MQFWPHFEIRNHFQMAAGLKTEMDHRSQGSGNEYEKYYALFGDRNLSKDFKMTHSVGGRAPWLTGAGVKPMKHLNPDFGHFRKVSEVTASCRGLVWIMGQEKLLTWSVSEGGEITVVTFVLFRFILSSWTQNIRILHCQDVFPLQIGGNDTGPTFPTGWSGLFLCQRTWRAGKSKH